MEIGLGIDTRYALSEDDQRTIAREAASVGYGSLWTPWGTPRAPFDICALWHESSRLATGIAVTPLSGWSIGDLAPIARDPYRLGPVRFTLGIGSGRLTAAPIRVMRDAVDALRPRFPGSIYLGALGPQMLHLAGERYDGAALNWCSAEQVAWSRERVAEGARHAGRDPRSVAIHEYIRVCVDEDESAARTAFAKMVLLRARAPGRGQDQGLPRALRAHGL